MRQPGAAPIRGAVSEMHGELCYICQAVHGRLGFLTVYEGVA
jgi:hypothetical protein